MNNPLIIYGKAGTGKTELADKIAAMFNSADVCALTCYNRNENIHLDNYKLIIVDREMSFTDISLWLKIFPALRNKALVFITQHNLAREDLAAIQCNGWCTSPELFQPQKNAPTRV